MPTTLVLETIRSANLTGIMKPLSGRSYRPDTEMPAISDSDICPYPEALDCDKNAVLRTFDGSCNNLERNIIGRAMTPFRRLLSAKYSDGWTSTFACLMYRESEIGTYRNHLYICIMMQYVHVMM